MIRYFDDSAFKELLAFKIETIGCKTLSILNKKHKLELPETPTNTQHAQFLGELRTVEGITNHGSLFSAQEDVGPEDDEDLAEKLQKEMGCLGGINYGAGR
jgi:hypothetical protein